MLSMRRYSTWDQFLGFNRYFRSLIDVNRYSKFLADIYRYSRSLADVIRYFILVEFSGIIRLVKSSKFLRYRVDISGNLRLINLSKFFKFQFRVRVVFYRVFLLTTGGGK